VTSDKREELLSRARSSAHAATRWLLSHQSPEGWWKGNLETNVTMDAEDLLLRWFLGVLTPGDLAASANWIRSAQRSDGTWASFYGGPPELSTTVEAYVALRLAGDPAEADHMVKAAEYVRDSGGIPATRVFTRIWLALFGVWPWERLPVLPPEIMLLPKWFPLNIYDFACWARQTIVPLTIVMSRKPVRPLPMSFDELFPPGWHPGVEWPDGRPERRMTGAWPAFFKGLDKVLHRYERHRIDWLHNLCIAMAERWILQRQEADGSWGGIQPPWVYSILALHLLGYPMDHPAIQAGMRGLESFTVRETGVRWLEACQSPVWDTALAVIALSDAGMPPEDPALVHAGRWLLSQQIFDQGDWMVRRPRLSPGGWAFEFANRHYPDVDDTAEVLIALSRTSPGRESSGREAISRGARWALGMQDPAGGFAAFDVGNDQALCTKLPFCDFGEVIDPPSSDVSAHVLEMMALLDQGTEQSKQAVIDWLLSEQEPDGSWFGRWGVNYVYGTGAAVPALVAAGMDPSSLAIRRAVRWLYEHQDKSGGWGEDPRSYEDRTWAGRGEPTASQTAWALLALLAAGERGDKLDRGVQWLVDTQQEDGSWDEPWFTGTGFPRDFYINYHLYRMVFPLMALGRYVSIFSGEGPKGGGK